MSKISSPCLLWKGWIFVEQSDSIKHEPAKNGVLVLKITLLLLVLKFPVTHSPQARECAASMNAFPDPSWDAKLQCLTLISVLLFLVCPMLEEPFWGLVHGGNHLPLLPHNKPILRQSWIFGHKAPVHSPTYALLLCAIIVYKLHGMKEETEPSYWHSYAILVALTCGHHRSVEPSLHSQSYAITGYLARR